MSASLLAQMTEIPISSFARERAAWIYVLLNGDEVIYVGQTSNPMQRIGMHRVGNRCCAPKDFDRVFVRQVPLAEVDAYEGAFIRQLVPTHCHTAPFDEGRDREIFDALGLAFDETASERFRAKSNKHYKAGQRHMRVWQLAIRKRRRVSTSKVLWQSAVRFLEAS